MSHTVNSSKRPKRLLPEPIETSSRSSKSTHPYKETASLPNDQNFLVPQLESKHQNRKLIPNQKGCSVNPEHDPSTPWENTTKRTCTTFSIHPSHCAQAGQGSSEQHVKQNLISPGTTGEAQTGCPSQPGSPAARGDGLAKLRPRKFTPQLMETAKRSVHRGAISQLSSNKSLKESQLKGPKHSCMISDVSAGGDDHAPQESPFSYSSLQRRCKTRRHSFRVPDLPAIPSSCSESSDVSELPSLSASPPPLSREPVIISKVEQDRRESCDEQFSSYLLSLAARSAERQLKDQALAAFPNEQVYQPVDHFAINREEECSSGEELNGGRDETSKHRRASSADLSWELECMRWHKEEAEMRDRAMAGTNGNHLSSTFANRRTSYGNSNSPNADRNYKPGIARQTTSPPMLGDDLVFPQSLSPDSTFCDSSSSATKDHGHRSYSGLWCADPQFGEGRGDDGLWMGTCKADGRNEMFQDPLPSGMLTPKYDEGNPLVWLNGASRMNPKRQIPPSPLTPRVDNTNRKLRPEENPESDMHDNFVTQIYNYLSLGYPCVARYYDHELSKISGISVADLRQDDSHTDAKGYVSVPEGDTTEPGAGTANCMRWFALRLYICEWTKQQPQMAEGGGSYEAWGVRERRGSWAV